MYKKMIRFNFILTCIYLALSNSYAMDDEENLSPLKRLRDEVGGRSSKRQKPNPSLTNENIKILPDEILNTIISFLSTKDLWSIRSINMAWKQAANRNIVSLNLSSRYWVPWEKRSELINAKEPVILDSNPAYTIVYENQKLYLQAKKNAYSSFRDAGSDETFYTQPLEKTYCTASLEDLWKSKNLFFGGAKLFNPFMEKFCAIKIDLQEFPNLTYLDLSGNTGMDNTSLQQHAPKLTQLILQDNKFITHEGLYLTKQLTTLDVRGAPQIQLQYLSALPLQKLILDGEPNPCQKDIVKFFFLPNLKELFVLDGELMHLQQMMHIVEHLFLLPTEQQKYDFGNEIEDCRIRYERRILCPNHLELGASVRKTTWSFTPFVRTSWKDADKLYIKDLEEYKKNRLVSLEKKNDDSSTDSIPETLENPWEISTEIYKIAKELLRITGKDLKIFIGNDVVIGNEIVADKAEHQILKSLEEIIQKDEIDFYEPQDFQSESED